MRDGAGRDAVVVVVMVMIPSREARTPHVRARERTERQRETGERTEGIQLTTKKRVHTWVSRRRRAGEPRWTDVLYILATLYHVVLLGFFLIEIWRIVHCAGHDESRTRLVIVGGVAVPATFASISCA